MQESHKEALEAVKTERGRLLAKIQPDMPARVERPDPSPREKFGGLVQEPTITDREDA
jgi:hypothetical protein